MFEDDRLMRYCVAFDAGNFALMAEILEGIADGDGLIEGINFVHARFDIERSYTEQLNKLRDAKERLIHD